MDASFCSKCGTARAPEAAFCSKCGQPFEAIEPKVVEPMQNVGMLPTTKYGLIGVLLIGIVACFAIGGEYGGWVYALIWTGGWMAVYWIWSAIRQAQVDLEWQRRLRR